MAHNYAEHPSLIQHLGVLLEEFRIADIAHHDSAHVPFSTAFNGASLGFPIPDLYIWGALVASIVYTAFQWKLL